MSWAFVERSLPSDRSSAVQLAVQDDDLRAVEKLWQMVYGRELAWLPSDDSTRVEDQFHPVSTYLTARIGNELVGTMRIVVDSHAGLPVEQFVEIDDIRASRSRVLAEVQRLMILPKYRNTRCEGMPFGVLAAMIKGCLHWCVRNGVSHVVADLFLNTATTPIKPLLAIGFEETGLEFVDAELNENDKSTALLLEIGELFSRSFRCDSPFYRYMMAYDHVVDVY